MKKISRLLSILLVMALFACSDDDASESYFIENATVSGKAEKGPFVQGSSVTLYELDDNLQRTGNSYETKTTDNAGTFAYPDGINLHNRWIELEVKGICYNESTAALSSEDILLTALTDLSDKENININVLTHLSAPRIRALVKEGSDFKQAKAQAEKELLQCFSITTPISGAENITLTGKEQESAILLAVSGILTAGSSDDLFNAYMSAFGEDLARNGAITDNDIKEGVTDAQKTIDDSAINAALTAYYNDRCNQKVTLQEFWQYIDKNGDGVLDEKDKPSSQVTGNAFQEEDNCIAYLTQLHKQLSKFTENETVLEADYCGLIELKEYLVLTPATPFVRTVWEDAYKVINQCNSMIKILSDTEVSYDKAPYLASAETLRALVAVTLTQLWGDIPYLTPEQWGDADLQIYRTPVSTVYTDLKERLLAARESLPATTTNKEKGIVSKALADVLLATIGLEQKDGASALSHLNKITESNLYELNLTNEPDIYYTEDNKESIYFTRYPADGITYPLSSYCKYILKGDLHPLYRYTGVMLNTAECYWRQGKQTEAIETLNKLGAALKTDSSSDAIRDCIHRQWKERLGTEYGYFALLKRLGIACEVMNREEYQLYFPIPQEETDRNPGILQNPGYDTPEK